jgi:hypothetical protein
MKKKILIIIFLLVVVIILKVAYPKFFANLLLIINHQGSLSGKPFLESCIQSEPLTYDKISGNSIKYIACIKGYTYIQWETRLISQVTDGYLISDKNQKIVSIIPIQKYNNRHLFNELEKNGYPSFSLKEDGFFLLEKLSVSNLENLGVQHVKVNELFGFNNNKIEKIRDVLVGSSYVFAFRDNEVFYKKNGQSIVKENILTGKLTTLLSSDELKKDSFYNQLYNVCVPKMQDNFVATFQITTNFDKETHKFTREYYSLDLDSGKLTKISFNGDNIIHSNCNSIDKKIMPTKITYSYLEGIASTYDLNYMPNREMDVYDFLLQRKGGPKYGLPQ